MKSYATLKDVAALAGTTAATVSYVVNEKAGRYISDETRRKVLKAVKKLNYIKCNGASSLKGQARKLIAILVPQFANQFFTRIIMAAEEVFMRYGYDMVICNNLDNPEREREILHRMMQQRVDGILLTPTIEGFKNTAILRKVGVKMVVIDRPLEGTDDFYWVTTDNYQCGYTGASCLMEKGHKKIAFIDWESHIPDLNKRRQAFLDAAKKYQVSKNDIIIKEGDFSAAAGYRLTAEVMEQNPKISAFFYGFNVQALGGIKYLAEHDIDIPKEKSVIMIGSPEWATTGRNNFTHIDMGEYELGKKAAEILMDLIRHPLKKPAKYVVQNCTLVDGNSVVNIQTEPRPR